MTKVSHESQPYTPEKKVKRESDSTYLRRQIGAIVIVGAAIIAGGNKAIDIADGIINPTPAKEKAEQEAISSVNDGGEFYLGPVSVKAGGNVRSEPFVFNGESADGTPPNTIEYPDGLVLVDGIVYENGDGAWVGFMRETENGEDWNWVHEEELEDFDRSLIADFDSSENPEPFAEVNGEKW